MMYPPYTFLEEFRFVHLDTDEVRVANASEREVLMGYERGFTRGLYLGLKKAVSKREGEVLRCQAVGLLTCRTAGGGPPPPGGAP